MIDRQAKSVYNFDCTQTPATRNWRVLEGRSTTAGKASAWQGACRRSGREREFGESRCIRRQAEGLFRMASLPRQKSAAEVILLFAAFISLSARAQAPDD